MTDADGPPQAAAKPMLARVGSVLLAVAGLVLLAFALWRLGGMTWGERIWLVGFFAASFIRAPYAARNRKNVIKDDRRDLVDRLLLTAMFLTMMFLPLLHLAVPSVFAFADYRLPEGAWIAGALLLLLYLILFWRSHADLGRNWSPTLEVRDEHRLVTEGIYARIRHPMYAAIWLATLAQPLLIQNWIAGALVVAAFAALYVIRVPREEAMLRAEFGEAYDAYCGRANRLWPKRLPAD